MNTWILLDCSYLVYRATYAMRDAATPVYGFLATIESIRRRFDSDRLVFCFDRGKPKRCELLPTYKQKLTTNSEDAAHTTAKSVMKELRLKLLPKFGFKNIFSQVGYEADDIIASIVMSLDPLDDAVIVTSDNDFFQLLSPHVVLFNPTKEQITNEAKFSEEWCGLSPDDWPLVKAIAGCKSDNVPGISGVGEKTAAKFLSGELSPYTATCAKISGASRTSIENNLKLVRLPFDGVNTFDLVFDKADWNKVRAYSHI